MLLGLLPTLISCQTSKIAEQQKQQQRVPTADVDTARSESPGPIDDCLNFSVLYSRGDGLISECTLNYTHYFSEKVTSVKRDKVRIGSFNLYHLGDNQPKLKNYNVVANIINQWDIVGAQEFMPLPGDYADSNARIFELLSKTGNNNDFVQKKLQVEVPGYLKLLNALRKLDPNWALILQPTAEGEGTSGEMAGFFYRQSVVQLRDWSYCPVEKSTDLKSQRPTRNLACLVDIPEHQRKLISRRAFATYFRAGNFDFVGLTAHVRFRGDKNPEAIATQKNEICANHVTPLKCKPTGDDLSRFYEVKAIADQIDTIQKQANDQDVIYMGDFNLELNKRTVPTWNAVLKAAEGFKVYQDKPTTLSTLKNSLASNYDHFIFNPDVTKACSGASARPYNFTAISKPMTELQKITATASLPDQIQLQIQARMSEIENIANAKVVRGKLIVSNLDRKEIEDFRTSFKELSEKVKRNFTTATFELVSDHIPVEMECSTK